MLAQQLHDALGAAGRLGDEYLYVLPVARALDVGHPIAEPPAELHRRLAGHVPVAGGRRARRQRLADLQRVQRRGAGEPGGRLPVVHLQRRGRRRRIVARGGVRVARPNLLCRLSQAIRDLRRFGDHETGRCATDVVVESPAAIRRGLVLLRIAASCQALELFGEGPDGHVVQGGHRALRRRIEAAERLDVVPDEFGPDREGLPCREHVDHTAASAEFSVGLDRVAAREPGVDEPIGQDHRGVRAAEPEIPGCEQEPVRRAYARQQRPRRGDDDPGLAQGHPRQGPRAGGGDVQVRRHAAVRVHLRRRERKHAPLGIAAREPLEPRQEEPGIGHHPVDVRISRNHDHHRPAGGEHGGSQGLRRRGQTADRPAGGRAAPQTGAGGRVVQQGAKRQRRGGRRQGGDMAARNRRRTLDSTYFMGCGARRIPELNDHR